MIKLLKKIYRKLIKRKPISIEILRYMNNNPAYKKYAIGNGSYGFPKIHDWGDGVSLKIGKYCSIGDNVSILLGGEHFSNYITTYPFQSFSNEKTFLKDRKTKGNIYIGNDVWIGNNVIILSGVTIGNGVIIGAGSVVTKNIEDYSIVAGNPVKLIRKRFTESQISELNLICWWNWDDKKIQQNIKYIVSPDIEKFISKNYV